MSTPPFMIIDVDLHTITNKERCPNKIERLSIILEEKLLFTTLDFRGRKAIFRG